MPVCFWDVRIVLLTYAHEHVVADGVALSTLTAVRPRDIHAQLVAAMARHTLIDVCINTENGQIL